MPFVDTSFRFKGRNHTTMKTFWISIVI